MLDTLDLRINLMRSNTNYSNVFPIMTWEEKAAIQLYTEETHFDINNYLRNSGAMDLGNEGLIKNHISCISSGLSKTGEKYKGPCFRGMSFLPEMLAHFYTAWQKGRTIKFNAFTSASKDRDGAFSFAVRHAYTPGTKPVIMKINSKTGVDISSLSVYPEREILFDTGLTFKIDLIEESEDGYFINVNEV